MRTSFHQRLCRALPAIGGGFTQPPGETFADLTFRTLDSGSFQKYELQAYLEHGIAESFTFLIKSPHNWIENRVEGQTFRNENFLDQERGRQHTFLSIAPAGDATRSTNDTGMAY
jgi:hypothetical protein